MMSRPRIAFVPGDPNGIGPELAAKLLARPANVEAADVIVFADPATIAAGERVANVKALLGVPGKGRATLEPLELGGDEAITPGVATEAGGRAALWLWRRRRSGTSRRADGIVCARSTSSAAPRRHDPRRRAKTAAGTFPCRRVRLGIQTSPPLWTSALTSRATARRRRCDQCGRGREAVESCTLLLAAGRVSRASR